MKPLVKDERPSFANSNRFDPKNSWIITEKKAWIPYSKLGNFIVPAPPPLLIPIPAS